MAQPSNTSSPAFVILGANGVDGERISLASDHLAVGRAPDSDIRLDDPHVSRVHASLWQLDGGYVVEDLGSSGGTTINGRPLVQPQELYQGDVVGFATVSVRYEQGPAPTKPTQASQASPSSQTDQSAYYDIGRQSADTINNVARDQYNVHVQQIMRQRENFLREIAGRRTKARILVWAGIVLVVCGFGLFAAGIMRFFVRLTSADSTSTMEDLNPFGAKVFGFPSGLLGWAAAAAGAFMVLVGVILHVTATARAKRVERDFQVPPRGAFPKA